jgi:U4/U6 small nuclear ribonucleoprotein PRP31
MKERTQTTELHKLQNRVAFGQAEEEVIVFDETEGLGMINRSMGTGRVRAVAADNRGKRTFLFMIINNFVAKVKQQKKPSASSGATSGLSSSLVFTPVQGMELVDPTAQQQKLKAINEKWFSANAQFMNIKKPDEK